MAIPLPCATTFTKPLQKNKVPIVATMEGIPIFVTKSPIINPANIPSDILAKKAKTLPVEIIIRQYITGSLWREYSSGINGQYGFTLDDGFKENQKFDICIITPSTKADYGEHDQPISREKIIADLVPEGIYSQAEKYAIELFKIGQKWAD